MHVQKSLVAAALVAMGVVAAVLPATASQTPVDKEITAVYQNVVKADELFGKGDYAAAETAFAAAQTQLAAVLRRNPKAATPSWQVGPRELVHARRLDLGFRDFAPTGTTSMNGSMLEDVLEKLLSETRQVLGKDENWPDEFQLDRAIGVVKFIEPPVPDADSPIYAFRLKLAVEKIEAALKRTPSLRNKSVRGLTGSEALELGRERLAAVNSQAQKAIAEAATAMPDSVKTAFEIINNDLDRVESGINKNGFVRDDFFERYLVGTAKFLADNEASLKRAYAEAGATAPSDFMKPIADRIAKLKAAAQQRAAGFVFPTGLVAEPTITNGVKAQLEKNLKGAKVLKIGMNGKAWTIIKDELGIPESRVRDGFVLYTVPGEKWARLSNFVYREDYAGGGRYNKSVGASSYSSTRWQQPK